MHDTDDDAREIAERMVLALDGWAYERDGFDAAEFMVEGGVAPTVEPGESVFRMTTGDGRHVKVTVAVEEDLMVHRNRREETPRVPRQDCPRCSGGGQFRICSCLKRCGHPNCRVLGT